MLPDKDYLYVDEPLCSRLVYNPDRRWEVWRFLTYSFIHADSWHLIHNLFGEIIVGVSLEMAHSSWRVALVYFSGVLGGALGSAVNTADATPLTGGSGRPVHPVGNAWMLRDTWENDLIWQL